MTQAESTRSEPEVFRVVEGGKPTEPLTEAQLEEWRNSPCNLLFDTTRGSLSICHRDEQEVRRVDLSRPFGLAESRRLKLFSSALDVLQTLVEHPGQRFTAPVLVDYIGRFLAAETLKKYIEHLRKLLHDADSQFPLIMTDRRAPSRISKSGPTYYADPDSHLVVISYRSEVR